MFDLGSDFNVLVSFFGMLDTMVNAFHATNVFHLHSFLSKNLLRVFFEFLPFLT